MNGHEATDVAHWPVGDAPWQDPPYLPTNEVIWQNAIDASLTDGSLRLEPTGHPDFVELVGSCPRCGHPLRQTLAFGVLHGAVAGERLGRFNIDCECLEPHTGRRDDRVGCGWGGPLPVEIREGAR